MERQPTTYLKLCTEFYDLEPHKDTEACLEFYMQYAQKAKGPILEPMCGTGRLLIPILQAGFAIEGFDASLHMLDAFKKKIQGNAPVWQQFVQDFNNEKLYNLIFIPYSSWGLIADYQESKKGLATMYRHLAQGGTFILEIDTTISIPTTCEMWHRSVHRRTDNSYIALNTFPTYNPATQIFSSICRYESIRKNIIEAVETEYFQQYLYRFNELDILLQEAGFTILNKFDDYSKKPADAATLTIIYECKK